MGLSIFRFVKYDTLNDGEKSKVEEAMIIMMENNKLAPTELEKNIRIDLYSRLERRWQDASDMEKQIREGTLVKIMLELLKY